MNKVNKTILVVDDEIKIVEILKSYLENEGYIVCTAYNGADAIGLFNKEKPSLIILDIMLPDINGTEVCEFLRSKSKVPIIMLTAKTEEEDILKGLNIGADDYMTKPFSPRQLVARVKALLRRIEDDNSKESEVATFNDGDLRINEFNYEVRKSGKIINLTPVEYSILVTISKHSSKVFTREELIYIALEGMFEGYDRTIDSHIKNLRQKIEDDPKNPVYIVTVRGIGYKFGFS
jgi:DNA-binding response OmpR family regulator